MKAAYRLFMLFLFLCVFGLTMCSCDSAKEFSPLGYNFDQDDQFYFQKPNISVSSMAESEKGYYFFSGASDSYLYYMDKKTMKPVVLCNKPNCLHSEETDAGKIQSCNAFFFNCHNLISYDNNLYVVGGDIYTNGDFLYKISLDGTSRQKIYTFKDGLQQLIIHRGYVYYDTNDFGTVEGQESSTANTVRVYRLNLKNLSAAPELVFEGKAIYGGIGKIIGYKNCVYFNICQYDSTLAEIQGQLYAYGLDNKKLSAIAKDAFTFKFYNDKLVFSDAKQNLLSCNLDGTDTRPINGLTGTPEYINGYLCLLNEKGSSKQLTAYDWNGNVIKNFDSAFAKCDLFGGDDRYFFMEDERTHNDFGNIQTVYIIDKDKLTDINQPEKLFEYIPHFQSPGFIKPGDN